MANAAANLGLAAMQAKAVRSEAQSLHPALLRSLGTWFFTASLVRALDLPQVPPVLSPVGLVSTTGAAPVSGNIGDGSLTAGVFQYDRRRGDADSPVEAATHDDTPSSLEATHQLRVFLETWLTGGAPTIVDPYAELGTPAL